MPTQLVRMQRRDNPAEQADVHPDAVTSHEQAGWEIATDPLDHDGDGRKGGSRKKKAD